MSKLDCALIFQIDENKFDVLGAEIQAHYNPNKVYFGGFDLVSNKAFWDKQAIDDNIISQILFEKNRELVILQFHQKNFLFNYVVDNDYLLQSEPDPFIRKFLNEKTNDQPGAYFVMGFEMDINIDSPEKINDETILAGNNLPLISLKNVDGVIEKRKFGNSNNLGTEILNTSFEKIFG